MSIFSEDMSIPIVQLYDKCREICNFVIPHNIRNYIECVDDIEDDIIAELKLLSLYQGQFLGLYQDRHPYDKESMYKICRVNVRPWGYDKLIPRYRVWFYYNSGFNCEVPSTGNCLHPQESYLADFVVSINGVEENKSL